MHTRRSVLKLGTAAGLAAAGLTPRSRATAQLLPPISRAFGATNGDSQLHVAGAGYAALENAGSFRNNVMWTLALLVRFRTQPPRPAMFFSQGGVGLCVQGARIGILVVRQLGPDQDEYVPTVVVSDRDVLVPANASREFPGYYAVYLRKTAPNGVLRYTVSVGDGPSTAVTGPVFGASERIYLGRHTDVPLLGFSENPASVECDFLALQAFTVVLARPLQLFAEEESRVSAYDFTTQPPKRLFDKSADGTYPRRPAFAFSMTGAAAQERRDGRDHGFAAAVARKLAPVVRLHSRDAYRPSSVEWFLDRASLVQGAAEMSYGSIGRRLTRPADLPLVAAGPLTGAQLAGLSSGTEFGSRGETDLRSLWPMEAAPGSTAQYDDGPLAVHPSPFSRYQVETLRGQPLVGGKCTAPAYCRISKQGDSHLLTYYFFYPYNGDMAPSAVRQWDTPPLADNTGYLAHIGDWERITAKVILFPSTLSVQLVDVTMEWHGNEQRYVGAPYAFAQKPVGAVGPLTVYSSWHSHASHASAGTFPTDTSLADDVTDDGPPWETGSNLVFITESTPWVRYNGLFGANLLVTATFSRYGAHALKNGPEGPAYHDLWSRSVTQTDPTR